MKTIDKIILLTIINTSIIISNCYSQQWTTLNSGTTNFLFNVSFPSNDTGYIVQDNGYIRKSIDGGQSWSLINSTDSIFDISFVSNDTGWGISYNRILKTVDGGVNWSITYTDPNGPFYWKIYALNSNQIYAIGATSAFDTAIVINSMNGGFTWTRSTFFDATGFPNSISFPDPSTGYIVDGSEFVYKSTDSGRTWNSISSWISPNNSVYFISPDTGFVMSTVLQMTTDGGLTWTIPNTDGISTAWYDMKFIDNMTGFVVGGDGITSGSILKTNDGGFNWHLDTSNVQTFNAISFTKNNIGFACGSSGILLKYDASTTNLENHYPITNVDISPNPFSEKLSFSLNNNITSEIIIYDLTLRPLFQKQFINSTTLNTEQLSKGVYLYELRTKEGYYLKGKVVKD